MRSLSVGLGVLALTAAGCNQILGITTVTLGDGGTVGDGRSVDVNPANCITGTMFTPCFGTKPTNAVTLTGAINTDSDTRCSVQHQASGPDLCVIGGNGITQTGNWRITGSRPIVLASSPDWLTATCATRTARRSRKSCAAA